MQSGSYRRYLNDKLAARRRSFWSQVFPAMVLVEQLESRTLLAGLPTQLQFQVQPPLNWAANAVLTPSSPVKVGIFDATGALVTTDVGTITLSLLGPGGITNAKLTNSTSNNPTFTTTVAIKASNGSATFSNLMIDTPGTYYLQAQYSNATNLTLNLATSNFFAVTPAAAKVAFNSQPANITAGDVFSLNINVQDSTGGAVSTDLSTGTVTISSGPVGASINGTTVVQAIGGVLTFSGLQLKTAGTYRLQVVAGNPTSITKSFSPVISNTFTVTAGAPAGLKFEQQPVNTPSGVLITPPLLVDVVDANGNLVNTNSSDVTIALAGTNGTLTGTTTRTAVNGVATFNDLSIAELGSGYRLIASDGSLTQALSNAFAITGPAAKLVFDHSISQTTVGVAIALSIVVLVEDDGGNIVANDSSLVTLSVGSGPGTIGGILTVAAVNGVATFPGITLSQMGTYTLTATDGSLNPGTSNSFVINGLATQLVFTQEPTGAAAGAAMPSAVKVTVQDSAGNTVVNSSVLVVLQVASGPGTITGNALNAVNGVATFSNVILSAAGTYTLGAVSGTLSGDTSTSFIVTPGATALIFNTNPSNVALKSTMFPAVVVHILDPLGNTVTTNSSTVVLTLLKHPEGGTMGGTTTVAAINGVATFSNLSFGKKGTYQLVAHDGLLTSATSLTFVVTNAATRLAFKTQPAAKVTAGAPIPDFSVRVTDKDGGLVNSDHSVVTLKIGSGPTGATIIGNFTTFTDHGIATFSGVSINVAGAYKFTVTDGALTGATSNKFTVVPDIANPIIALTTVPTSTLVGKTVSKIVIAIADQFRNTITTVNNGTISLSLSSGPGPITGKTTSSIVNGIATFTNLLFKTAGTYTLLATRNVTIGGVHFNDSVTLNTMISPVVTSMQVPGHANAYKSGQTFKLSGNVNSLVPSGGIPFTGAVNLLDLDTNTVLAHGTISAGGAFTVNSTSDGGIANGDYNVAMVYVGDTNHTGASSPSFNLKIGATTTKLTTNKANVSTSGTFTLTATISAPAGTTAPISGTVTFYDGDTTHMVGTAVTIANGKASIKIPNPAAVPDPIPGATVGSHNYFAVYSGDVLYFNSTSTSVTVNVT